MGHTPRVQARTAGKPSQWEKELVYVLVQICIRSCTRYSRKWLNERKSRGSWILPPLTQVPMHIPCRPPPKGFPRRWLNSQFVICIRPLSRFQSKTFNVPVVCLLNSSLPLRRILLKQSFGNKQHVSIRQHTAQNSRKTLQCHRGIR